MRSPSRERLGAALTPVLPVARPNHAPIHAPTPAPSSPTPGTIKAGCSRGGEALDIVSAFQSYGSYVAGTIDEEERVDIVRNSCPGAGACGGMYTANTMASAIEALGMTLPYSSSIPAEDPLKMMECKMAGAAALNLLKLDLKPRDIMVRAPSSVSR